MEKTTLKGAIEYLLSEFSNLDLTDLIEMKSKEIEVIDKQLNDLRLNIQKEIRDIS